MSLLPSYSFIIYIISNFFLNVYTLRTDNFPLFIFLIKKSESSWNLTFVVHSLWLFSDVIINLLQLCIIKLNIKIKIRPKKLFNIFIVLPIKAIFT